jgi:hypothetical protein
MLRRSLVLICLLALLHPPAVGQSSQQNNVIPEGTVIQLSLRDPLSSKLNEPGDEVVATIRRDVVADGYTLIREGTEVIGRVTLARPAKMPLKGGQLHVTFERIKLDGQERRLSATISSASDFTRDEKVKSDGEGTLQGGKSGGKVLENVGKAAAIGGIGVTIAILAGARNENDGFGFRGITPGAATGGLVVMGTSVVVGVLLTKGKEVRLDEKAIIRLKLERPLTID